MSFRKKYLYKILFFILLLFLSSNYGTYSSEKYYYTQKFCLIHFGDVNWKDFGDLLKKLDIIVIDYYRFPDIPRDIKEINPEIKVFAYINTFDVADLSRFDPNAQNLRGKTERMYNDWIFFDSREELFLHDFRGKRISVFLNKNIPRYAVDISNFRVIDFFRGKIFKVFSAGYDGVFLDNVWVEFPFSFGLGHWISGIPPFISKDKWSDATAGMLAELKSSAGKGKIIFNQINPSDIDVSMKYLDVCDGASDEQWLKKKYFSVDLHEESLKLISLAGENGKIILALSDCETYEDALFNFSAYLLVADGENIYFSAENSYNLKELMFYDFYGASIGKPISIFKKKEDDNDIFYRFFENGAVVVNFGNKSIDIRSLNDFAEFPYKAGFGNLEFYRLMPDSSVILVKKK